MTREEEIRQEMSKIAGTHHDWTKNDCMRMGFYEGAKWADEHPNSNGKELLYLAQKTAERTKKEIISKACEWLEQHQESYDMYDAWSGDYVNFKSLIVDFRKAMES